MTKGSEVPFVPALLQALIKVTITAQELWEEAPARLRMARNFLFHQNLFFYPNSQLTPTPAGLAKPRLRFTRGELCDSTTPGALGSAVGLWSA